VSKLCPYVVCTSTKPLARAASSLKSKSIIHGYCRGTPHIKGYHKVKYISKYLECKNNKGDTDTTMYREVHFSNEASLRWRGMEEQCPPNAQWFTIFSSSISTKMEVPNPLWILEGGHRPRISLGQSSQLNWRFAINLPQKATRLRQSPQLNLRSQAHHTSKITNPSMI
jgi:hypothetical protein